jgi:hypothetical protein
MMQKRLFKKAQRTLSSASATRPFSFRGQQAGVAEIAESSLGSFLFRALNAPTVLIDTVFAMNSMA